ncbi:PilN domain-containing protein [Candidatus Thiodictyon syntrophicum]|uniref:PilN domain-containing protein n=1 Tax=Candidatus Thiodictyon syntrophicum TaxID=1166950 RepID=UPI0012FD5647|nr:PilN domain-containing protein [Candidatus Thiodictyon syntrophicum]
MLATSLFVLALVLPLIRLQSTLHALSARAAILAPETQTVQTLAKRLGEREQLITNRLIERSAMRTRAETLLELTDLFPDDAWLQTLTIQRDTLVLQGRARNPLGLRDRLEYSAMFARVSLYAPLLPTRDSPYSSIHFIADFEYHGGE